MEIKKAQESVTDVVKYSGEITNLKVHLQVEKDLVVALKCKIEEQEKETERLDLLAPKSNKDDAMAEIIIEEGIA